MSEPITNERPFNLDNEEPEPEAPKKLRWWQKQLLELSQKRALYVFLFLWLTAFTGIGWDVLDKQGIWFAQLTSVKVTGWFLGSFFACGVVFNVERFLVGK